MAENMRSGRRLRQEVDRRVRTGITAKSRGKDYFAVQEAGLKAHRQALGPK